MGVSSTTAPWSTRRTCGGRWSRTCSAHCSRAMRRNWSRTSCRNRRSRRAISPRSGAGWKREAAMRSEWVATWLLTFALHAGVLLLVAWLVDRGRLRAQLAWRELLWRGALFGAVLSTSLQVLSGLEGPARLVLASTAPYTMSETMREPATSMRAADGNLATPPEPVAAAVPAARVDRAQAASASTREATASTFAWPSWPAVVVAAWLA